MSDKKTRSASKDKKPAAASPAAKAASPKNKAASPTKKGADRAASPKPAKGAKGAASPKQVEKKVEKKVAAPVKAAPAAKGAERFITVPETLLKRRKRSEIQKAESRKRKEALLKKRLANKKVAFTRAEQYVKEYRDAQLAEIRLKREAKKKNSFYVAPEAKLALVIRIRGINALPPKVRKITHLLRLRQIHNGVFVKVNKPTMNMIKLIEPYVTFGYPTLKTIRDLVYKRGFVKINKQRIPLTNNDLVEANLGKYGIICVEDMIHELYTCGPHFKEVNNFLWPFKLNSPRGGLVEKRIHYNEGGDYGNREELINEFARRML